MVHRLFHRLGSFTVRYRWLVVAVWVLGSIAAVRTLPSLSSQVNNDNSAFLPANAPSQRATDLAAPLGLNANVGQVLVVVDRPSGTLTSADTAAVQRIVTDAAHVPSVLSARASEVAPAGNAVVVLVNARVSEGSIDSQTTLVHRIQQAVAEAAAPPGLQVHLAGSIATNVANQHQSKKTGGRVQALSILLIVVLLFIVYRSALAPFLTLLPAALVLTVSGSFIGALASTGFLKVSEVTQVLLIVLLLGAGTDYGLFLVFRVREELRNGLDQHRAVVRGVERVGESITASAGTVVLALLSLLLASFGIYHDLGVPLALGIATMLLAGLTLLPALLAIFGRAAFWPTLPVPSAGRDGWWGRIARRIVARPALALIVGLVVFGGLAGGVAGYRAAGFGGALTAPKGSDAAQGNAALASYFPKASANPTNLVLRYPTSVWQDPAVLVAAERSLQASGLFIKLQGPLDPGATALTPTALRQLHQQLGDPRTLPLHPTGALATTVPLAEYEAYRATATLIGAGGHTVQFEATLRAGPPGSTAAMHAVPAVRAALSRAAHASGASAWGAAGEAPALYDVSAISNADVVHIVPVAIIAIGLLLALVMRSLVAPLYLIASVALSYVAALGLAVLLFVELGHSGGLTFLLPFLMFIFLLALGEDYNILMMTRIREESLRLPIRSAVARAVGATGTTVTSAGLVLAGSFFVLGFSGGGGPSGSQIQDIGFGLAIGILMDTFLVRTILVPSTVALLGRWNWWPSALARRHDEPADVDVDQTPAHVLAGTGGDPS